MESEHLAPHGVPGGFKPMARSRRNSTEEPVQAAVTQPNPMDDPGEFRDQNLQISRNIVYTFAQQTMNTAPSGPRKQYKRQIKFVSLSVSKYVML